MDTLNILDTIAFIARAEKFGLGYARCCQEHVEYVRKHGKGEHIADFRHNAGNYFIAVHKFDRKRKI